MANAVITVLEADGTTETDVTVLDVGRQAAAASKSVAASTEDKAVLDAIAASVAGATPAGTNAIGKLAANSGVDIGDVDVTSIAAGDNNIGNVDIVTVPADPFGANADAASVTGSISAKMRAMATAIGTTVVTRGAGASDAGTLRVTVDTGQLGSLGQAAMAASVPVAIASNQSDVGVRTPIQYITVDMTAETTALDAGDVVAATQVVAACTPANDVEAILSSIVVIDPDDQGHALSLVFFSANTTLGTEDAAPDIDDTEVQTVLGVIDVATTDYKDLGANKVATLRNVNLPIIPATGTDDIYMAIYTPTAPTYAGGHIYVRLGFI